MTTLVQEKITQLRQQIRLARSTGAKISLLGIPMIQQIAEWQRTIKMLENKS